jgi:hypothetical protein
MIRLIQCPKSTLRGIIRGAIRGYINDHPGTLDIQHVESLAKRVTGCVAGAVSVALDNLKDQIEELKQSADSIPAKVPNEN